jgi:hypothetical protein
VPAPRVRAMFRNKRRPRGGGVSVDQGPVVVARQDLIGGGHATTSELCSELLEGRHAVWIDHGVALDSVADDDDGHTPESRAEHRREAASGGSHRASFACRSRVPGRPVAAGPEDPSPRARPAHRAR